MKKADGTIWALPGNPYKGMVDGCWYRAAFSNGASYDFWVVRHLGPIEAQTLSVEFANGRHDTEVYEDKDLEGVKIMKGDTDG